MDFCQARFTDTNKNMMDIQYLGKRFVKFRQNIPGRDIINSVEEDLNENDVISIIINRANGDLIFGKNH